MDPVTLALAKSWAEGQFGDLRQLQQHIAALQAVSGLAPVVDELQTVSGLAAVADELQTVSGLAPVAGELQAVSELAPYVQALLDSRIVEMGSNSNGEYVRWENGLQVCFGRWQLHPSNGGGSYEVRTGSFDWVFPAGFLSVPLVVAMGEPEYWEQPWRDSTYPINDYGGCSLSWGPDPNRLVPSGTSTRINYWYRIFNGQLYMHALAVGRWK